MSGDRLVLLTPLRQALERIDHKAQPLLADPNLLDGEEARTCSAPFAASNSKPSRPPQPWSPPPKSASSSSP